MSATREYTALFLFAGIGGAALGFQDASTRLLGVEGRFRVVGGIDNDPAAVRDFVSLVKAPCLCADMAQVTPEQLRALAGDEAPDVVVITAPCKGSSKLLSSAKAKDPRYQAMNQLALVSVELTLRTWAVPPRLILFENVPNVTTRAKAMIASLKKALRAAGYLLHDGYHDAGELGGLAQHRRRWLMVARHARRVPPLLYQPPRLRVRACGEVLGDLPMPEDVVAGGPMHKMPRLSWINWVRLALIPAGGDWRDLEGVFGGLERREVFKRHAVESWDEPTGTVASGGSNGVANVADPRGASWFPGTYGVRPWSWPSATVTGRATPSTGAFTVADPRVGVAYDAGYAVLKWSDSARTIAGGSAVGQGAYSVADPRAPESPVALVDDPKRSPYLLDGKRRVEVPVVILAEDGTWHRPLTTLELAVLQGFPARINGAPLALSGASSSHWRTAIGNALPPPAAKAIAERMLVNLLGADACSFTLSGDGAVWVDGVRRAVVDAQGGLS